MLALAGCGAENTEFETPEVEWEGEWLRYGRSPGLAPQCTGTAPYMDRYVGALVQLFGVEPSDTVDFFYVDRQSTPCEALGCARDHIIFSLAPVQEHELVHAVRSFEGLSQLVLEEGAAEYWGDDSQAFAFRPNTEGDLLEAVDLVSADGLPSEFYGVAGRLHALLALDSPQAVGTLLRRTSPLMGREALSQQMVQTTGSTLEDWATTVEAYPACEHRQYRDPTPACQSVRTVDRCENGEVVEIEEYVACDDEETLGPRDGEIWKYVAVDIDKAGTYSLLALPDLETKLEGRVTLKECRGGCGSVIEEMEVPSSITPGRSFEAVPGRYLLRLTLPEHEAGWIRVWLAGSCQ
ncbi:MAG: hypothetical protein AAGF11_42850 [Myxococcota bacterium]